MTSSRMHGYQELSTTIELLRELLHQRVGPHYHPKAFQMVQDLSAQMDELVVAYMRVVTTPVSLD